MKNKWIIACVFGAMGGILPNVLVDQSIVSEGNGWMVIAVVCILAMIVVHALDKPEQITDEGELHQVELRKELRDKTSAGLLAIFLGGLGVHKFYLGKPLWGVIYLLLVWTSIPLLLGIIEGIRYLCMDKTNFNSRYN